MKVIREKFLPSIIVSILLASLGLGLRFLGISPELSLIIAGIILVGTFSIMLIIYRPIRRALALMFTRAEIAENGQDKNFLSFRSQLRDELGASSQVEIAKNSGISGWFPSFRDAKTAIIKKIESAREIRIITNFGKSDFAKGTALYDELSKNQKAKIRILLASPTSYFVSTEWAVTHQFDKEQSKTWSSRIKESIRDIQHLRDHHNVDVEYRLYNFPFVWHIWIVDETAFVSAWLERTKNVETVTVVEVQKDNKGEERHLYDMFFTFFERIWNEFSEDYKR